MLRVFPGKMRRRIFRPKRDEVAGKWRELYNEELNEMCDKWSCTGGHLLAHPPRQDILKSEQHNLIITDICECTCELEL